MPNHPRLLTALPVYNEAKHINRVLDEVRRHAGDIVVVDDGSDDGSREILSRRGDVKVVRHEKNRGYGAALKTAFDYTIAEGYAALVTIDCDGQHEPQLIGELAARLVEGDKRGPYDIVSGSRYLEVDEADASHAPADRRRINQTITAELNKRLGLDLTDAFCGFKAYCASALKRLNPTELGYAMPLELWVQAAYQGMRVAELATPLVYLDEKRSFGGALDEARTRLAYYRRVIDNATADLPRTMDPSWVAEPCTAHALVF